MTVTTDLRARNITAVYRQATDDERAAGTEWYLQANALARELDPNDPERAAAVIAVLSPRLSWELNVRAARAAYSGGKLAVLGLNALKAQQLVSGADPDIVVRGPKVRAFWRAITDPSDPSSIVIDRHAFDVAAGKVTDDETRKVLTRSGVYNYTCGLYVRASQILSKEYGRVITAVEVQATTWVAWRRMKKGMAS